MGSDSAFAGCEVHRQDDLLDFLVGDLINIEMARQPAAQSPVGVFDAALLPGRVSVAEPCRHVAHGPEQAMLGEGGIVVERD